MIIFHRPARLPRGITRAHWYQLYSSACADLCNHIGEPGGAEIALSALLSDIAAGFHAPPLNHDSVALFIVDPQGPTGQRLREIEQKEDAPFWQRENARRARVAKRMATRT